MPIIQSCCCWRSLRRGCYASAVYTMIYLLQVYFSVTIITMGHFIEMEQRYLSGDMTEPESESFLEPEKITPILQMMWRVYAWLPGYQIRMYLPAILTSFLTVSLNITLLACSTIGLFACMLLMFGVYKDFKYMLLPWVVAMGMETLVEVVNLFYLFYLQTLNFNPITSFLFTLDFFIIVLNVYAMICVISQFQEYNDGRGTAAFENVDRNTVQYTATAQQTTTTSSAPSGRRRSAGRPMPSRCDPEEFSEAPSKVIISNRPDNEVVSWPRPNDNTSINSASAIATEVPSSQPNSGTPTSVFYLEGSGRSRASNKGIRKNKQQHKFWCFPSAWLCFCRKGDDDEVKIPHSRSEECGVPPGLSAPRQCSVAPPARILYAWGPGPRATGIRPGRRFGSRVANKTVITQAQVEIPPGQRDETPEAKAVFTRASARVSDIPRVRVLPAVRETYRGRGRYFFARATEDVKKPADRAEDRWAEPGRGIAAIELSPQAGDNKIQVNETASVLSRPTRSAVKKHVQFPDEQSCIEEAIEAPSQPGAAEKPGERIKKRDCHCAYHHPRGTRYLIIVDGVGVRGPGPGALTAAERAVLPASFPRSERTQENVRRRSTARRRSTSSEGFPLN